MKEYIWEFQLTIHTTYKLFEYLDMNTAAAAFRKSKKRKLKCLFI